MAMQDGLKEFHSMRNPVRGGSPWLVQLNGATVVQFDSQAYAESGARACACLTAFQGGAARPVYHRDDGTITVGQIFSKAREATP